MATTPAINAWTNAVKYIKNYGGTQTLNSLDLLAMNAANRRFHLAAPWSWSVGALEEVALEIGTQDYPLVSEPTDFLRLSQVRQFVNGKATMTMDIVGNLPATVYSVGAPTQVTTYDTGTLTYRVWPKPSGFLVGKEPVLMGDYKRKTTEITSGNKSTADILLFPDEYYHVYELLVLHYAMLYANDMRAGTVTLDGMGRTEATGIIGQALSEINKLRQVELLSKTPEGGPVA